MSVYLGYDTITKQYLRDLVSDKGRVVREWTNYYVNVSAITYRYPHGYDNYPCSVRDDKITSITIKTLSFDDVTIAEISGAVLDVRARFVRPDKTIMIKELTSIDLSSKFSKTMLKDTSTAITCFIVNETINVGDAKGAVLFQMGVKTGIGSTPELAVIYAIG